MASKQVFIVYFSMDFGSMHVHKVFATREDARAYASQEAGKYFSYQKRTWTKLQDGDLCASDLTRDRFIVRCEDVC